MGQKYVASGVGPGMNTTAATAQNVILYNPASATMVSAKVYEWSAGPHANSADNTYTITALRTTTTGTFTNTITPRPLSVQTGGTETACVSLFKNTSSAAATTGSEVGRWGWHMRGGYRWVAIPGGELATTLIFSAGITFSTVFAQGSDQHDWSVWFDE
jgi:hypothetical protein